MIEILIVEDEMPISELLRLSLTKAGYHCICAMDGIEAANRIEKESFDLILLDVMLPGMDGFALMDYIQDLGTPVIFITAKNAVSDRVRGLRMGAEDYIVKPFEILELLARVEGVLRRHGKLAATVSAGGRGDQHPGHDRKPGWCGNSTDPKRVRHCPALCPQSRHRAV